MTNNVCSVLASLLILFGVAGLKIYIQIRHLKQIRQKMKGRNFSLFSFDRKEDDKMLMEIYLSEEKAKKKWEKKKQKKYFTASR